MRYIHIIMKSKLRHILLLLLLLSPLVAAAQAGIDVSRFQDTIRWKKVVQNKNLKFVYIKASEGASIRDAMYRYNIRKAREAGLLVGSYHVYSSKSTAYDQFRNFKTAVGKEKQDIVPVLDIEAVHCHKLNMKRVDKLLELMENEYGVKPMIYTSEKLYHTHFHNSPKHRRYHFFIANYKRKPNMPYTVWQYTQQGSVAGVRGPVDLSRFHPKYSIETIKIVKKKAVADTTAK